MKSATTEMNSFSSNKSNFLLELSKLKLQLLCEYAVAFRRGRPRRACVHRRWDTQPRWPASHDFALSLIRRRWLRWWRQGTILIRKSVDA